MGGRHGNRSNERNWDKYTTKCCVIPKNGAASSAGGHTNLSTELMTKQTFQGEERLLEIENTGSILLLKFADTLSQ